MNDNPETLRDERSVTVENASYRLAHVVLSVGVLLSAVVRGLVLNESSWDLLGLLVLSGGVATFYQITRKTMSWRMVRKPVIVSALTAIVAGVVFAFLKAWTR